MLVPLPEQAKDQPVEEIAPTEASPESADEQRPDESLMPLKEPKAT